MSDFWCWVLIIIALAAIFGAGKLPDLRNEAKEKLKLGLEAFEKGKEELNKKIAEKNKKNTNNSKKEANNSEEKQ